MKLKYILLNFFLFVFVLTVYCQTKQIIINNNKFQIEFKNATSDGRKSETINLYRENKKLLTHTTLKEDGDCSSISVELGKYEIDTNSITFYSFWATADRMPSFFLPFGFRKQTYSVDEKGKLTLTNSKIYIEGYLEQENANQNGLKFLNETPKNDFEKKALENYIKATELEFNSKFVLGKEKEMLEKEVRKIMNKEITQNTGDWVEGEIYGKVKK